MNRYVKTSTDMTYRANATRRGTSTPEQEKLHSTTKPTAPDASKMRYLTDQERDLSMHRAMAHWREDQDIWIYGYGSLIWNPEFDYSEKRIGTLRGHHRALCLWSRVNRGTPEQPGLVFGLDRGGSCRGMAFRIDSHQVPDMLPRLWRREMSTGAYLPRWLRCDTDTGPVQALAFVIDRTSPGYVKEPHCDHAIEIIHNASGTYGPCSDYVLQTYHALREAGIHDARLHRIVEQLHVKLGRKA